MMSHYVALGLTFRQCDARWSQLDWKESRVGVDHSPHHILSEVTT